MAIKRTVINGPRQTGTVVAWEGDHGFIQPSKPATHPSAKRNKGKVYLAQGDVVEELDGIGCTVSFTLYTDLAKGLGASDVKMANSKPAPKPQPVAQKGKAKGAGKAAPKVAAPTWTKPAPVAQPAFQKKGGEKGVQQKGNGKAKEVELARLSSSLRDARIVQFALMGKSKGMDQGDKSKGKGKGNEGRTIIHNEPLLGVIVQWKGKFGWVKPNDTIDHPNASAHQGDLYLGMDDVEEEIDGEGALVQFMLYEDERGLGASNVKPAH